MFKLKYLSLCTLCLTCLMVSTNPVVLAHTHDDGNLAHEERSTTESTERIEDTSADRNEIVSIPDPNLKRALNEKLGQAADEDITKGQLRSFSGILYLDHLEISDITGLEECINLEGLDLSYNNVIDLSPITSLTKLTNLYLEYNQIQSLVPLTNLTQLVELHLSHNNIREVSSLTKLVQLHMLHLAYNQIIDITSLSSLTNLTELTLGVNQIHSISALSTLTKLVTLTLEHNQIEDISALASLINLNALDLSYNQIKVISALQPLTRLTVLYLDYNLISDLSVFQSLTSLTRLGLSYNRITDISTLQKLTQLTELSLMEQIITLSAINVFPGENATLLNPIHDLDHAYITPASISNEGYYDSNDYTINWLNVQQAQSESFTFERTVSLGNINTLFSGKVSVPLTFNGNSSPVLIVDDQLFLQQNQIFNPMDYVSAYDEEDGDITEWIIIKENTIDLTQLGSYSITFEVTDSYGATTSKTVTVQVGSRIAPDTGLSFIFFPLGLATLGTGIYLKRRQK